MGAILFMVCLYVNDTYSGYKRAEKVNETTVCDRNGGYSCNDAYTVKFKDVKPVKIVYQTDCLFITEGNKNAIQYQE